MSTNHPTNPPVKRLAMAATIRRRAREGLHPTNLPLGYRCDEGMVAVPDPAVAPLVREAILLMGSGRHTVRGLLVLMTKKGLRSKAGRPVSASALHEMLTNRFYAGIIFLDGKEFPGLHEPLVGMEAIDVNRRLLASRRRGQSRGTGVSDLCLFGRCSL